MKISLNWLKEYTKIDLSIDELVKKIGAQLGGVDEVVDFGKKYENIAVVKVVSCKKHPDADKLNICLISDDSFFEGVERNEQQLIQVVCGAPNVREGMLAVWIPPGVTVPSTASKEPFVLEVREIRGQKSSGMLASLKELGIGDNHEGILEVDEDVRPGAPFSEAYDLDDYIIDIENKMFTHRPDLFGFLGIAREVAGIQHLPFKSPDWYVQDPKFPAVESEELKLEVRNEIPELVPRFTAITMSGVQLGSSPLWLQIFLAKMGIKSINNIVDYSNFFMMETAQPIHIYDYDKVKALSSGDHATMVIRHSNTGEMLTMLNGKTIKPAKQTMMVATDQKLICVGGAIGGAETEVDKSTKNIIIEAANWDMYQTRRTSMEYGIFTDAVTRLTKGQSPLQNLAVMAKIVDEISQHTGGKVASQPSDIKNEALVVEHQPLEVEVTFINARLGLILSSGEITTLLQNVEFKVSSEGPTLKITVPFWRTDIKIAEDIIEEVGRLYGYDRLPLELPKRSIVPVGPDGMLRLKQTLRHILASFGAHELLTYSFVHGNLLARAGQDKDEAYTISNALSPDLQYYRLTLTPSLLAQVHPNIKAGHENFALFELGKMHTKKQEDTKDVPKEIETLAFVVADSRKQATESMGAPFYQARSYLDQLADKLGLELVYYPVERDPKLAIPGPFDLQRSAFVAIKDSNGMLGMVGEYSQVVRKNLKLPNFASGFEIGVKELLAHTDGKNKIAYTPLSRYPGTWQDICFQVLPKTLYKEVHNTVVEALSDSALRTKVDTVDIYQPDSDEYKNITLRIYLTNPEHTITADEATTMITKVADLAKNRLKAKII